MPLPRVIATDLDGTLLDAEGRISPRNRQALHSAARAGVRVVVVTARPLRTAAAYAEQFPCSAVVCGNGAVAHVDGRPDPLVRAMDRVTGTEVVKRLQASIPAVGFAVETGTHFFHERSYELEPWLSPAYVQEVLDTPDALLTHAAPVAQLVARSTTVPVEEMHRAAVDAAAPLAEITFAGGAGLLGMSASGVNKGSTLALLCGEWGVAAEDVVAFGDMPNDLSSLTWAGSGYAMANAHPSLTEPAAGLLSAPSHAEDGVARVVEEILDRA